jgi:hypothetical protein
MASPSRLIIFFIALWSFSFSDSIIYHEDPIGSGIFAYPLLDKLLPPPTSVSPLPSSKRLYLSLHNDVLGFTCYYCPYIQDVISQHCEVGELRVVESLGRDDISLPLFPSLPRSSDTSSGLPVYSVELGFACEQEVTQLQQQREIRAGTLQLEVSVVERPWGFDWENDSAAENGLESVSGERSDSSSPSSSSFSSFSLGFFFRLLLPTVIACLLVASH